MLGRQLSGRQRSVAVTVTLLGLLFLTFIDNTVVAVALSQIQHSFRISVAPLQWIVNGYALAFAAAMLPAGALSDEYGRKRVLLIGASLFCAGSVMCGLAPTWQMLIAGRVVMGLGAAGSEPGTLSMLGQIFPVNDPRRGRVLGLWAAVSGLALALGPVIGGTLIQIGGWRLVFWAGLASGLVLVAAGMLLLPESSDPHGQRIDYAGALLGMLTLAAVVVAVVRAESFGYRSVLVLSLLLVGAVSAVGFVLRERSAANPLLNLQGTRKTAFAMANIAAFTTYFAIFAVFLFTVLYLQEVAGENGWRIALQFLPLTAGMIVSAFVAGSWTNRRGTRRPVTAGCAVFGIGLLLTDLVIKPDPNHVVLALTLTVIGIGIGLTVVPITDAALMAVPDERTGMAASATNTSRELGAVVGVSVLGAIVSSRLTADLTVSLRQLHIPTFFANIIITSIEHAGLSQYDQLVKGHPKIVNEVVAAAHDAFGNGVHVALVMSAILVLTTGLGIAIAGWLRPDGFGVGSRVAAARREDKKVQSESSASFVS